MKKYIPLLVAIILLIGAWFYGESINKMDAEVVNGFYESLLPDAAKFDPIDDKTAVAYKDDGTVIGYVGVSTNVGYGGPLTTGIVIDESGKLKAVSVLDHKETPAYLDKIARMGFYRQFEKVTATDSLTFGYDIEGVSGATLSTRAITNSVKDVSHSIAASKLGATPAKAQIDWQVGIQEIAVALLFILALVFSRVKQLGKYRLVLLAASIVILGFWLNRSASIAQISALFLGYFPAPQTNLIWYIVLIGAILPAVITGKNFYCTYVCPFCGLQEATHLLSRINMPLGKNIKWIRIMRDVILFAVIFIAFLVQNPSTSGFEPFGTIFGLNGSSFQWYLLFAALVISFFFKRFWCTAFCPVGAFLDKVSSISRDIRKALGIGGKKKAKKEGSTDVA